MVLTITCLYRLKAMVSVGSNQEGSRHQLRPTARSSLVLVKCSLLSPLAPFKNQIAAQSEDKTMPLKACYWSVAKSKPPQMSQRL